MAKKDWMIKESELDDDQIEVLNSTLDKSCIVEGRAGSGKSVLALIKAQRIQKERGDSYKIIVFTKALCDYMNAGRQDLGLRNYFSYHWEWKNRQRCSPADYIIVDEIQDFDEGEIKEFVSAARKNFFFFGDTAQSLYEGLKTTVSVGNIVRVLPMDKNPKHFSLYRNYRLPLGVAKFVQYVGVDLEPFGGEKIYRSEERTVPRVLQYGSLGEQIAAIKRIRERNDFSDVAILVPDNEMVKTVGDLLRGFGVNFEQRYNDKADYQRSIDSLNFSTSNPKVMTYHSAKGLQFETVFLPGVERFYDDGKSRRKALYVAMTRTYRHLYVMYSGSMPRVLASIPSDLYVTKEEDDKLEDI